MMNVYIARSEYGEDIHGVATSKARALEILRDNCPRNAYPEHPDHTCPNGLYCDIDWFSVDERTAQS